jgi:galactose mutarotase-like enzyme
MTSITLRAGAASAEIALLGAEARAWAIAGRHLLWRPDPAVWPDVAPILFPVVGWTIQGRVRVGETYFPLGLHGFARQMAFAVAGRAPDFVRLDLTSDGASRALYPFEFRLSIDYRLRETSLSTVLTVTNCGSEPMPYACGLHPGFCWPFAGGESADYRLRFEQAEEPFVPEISNHGLLLPTRRGVALDGAVLPLTPALFAREALCFLDAKSRSVSFEHSSGAAIVVEAPDFPHFALWARPPAPFLAIESWTGHGDPADFAGDLFEKPGMRLLPPGSEARHAATYHYKPSVP